MQAACLLPPMNWHRIFAPQFIDSLSVLSSCSSSFTSPPPPLLHPLLDFCFKAEKQGFREMGRKPCCDKVGLRRGAWTMEEDQKLINFILINGIQCWRHVSELAGLKRCGKSCRLRWTNYLRPDVKRGSFTEAEEDQIIELHSQLGNRWSKIASHFPGRTDNEIKNHWNTGIKKRLKLLGLDPLTHNPIIQHVPDQDSNISGEVDADEVNKATEITKNQEDRHLELSVKDEEKQNSTNEMLNLWESIEEGGEQMKVGEAKPSSSGRSSSNSFMSIDDTHNSTSAELTELCWDVPIDSFPSWEELYFLGDFMPFVNYP